MTRHHDKIGKMIIIMKWKAFVRGNGKCERDRVCVCVCVCVGRNTECLNKVRPMFNELRNQYFRNGAGLR